MPSEIGLLSNLRVLQLFKTPLFGNVPPQIANLLNLKTLCVRVEVQVLQTCADASSEITMTELSGNLPLPNGWNIELIYIYDNSFEGSIPNTISSYNNLTYLFVQEQCTCAFLVFLLIHRADISGTIPNMENLTCLKSLSLRGMELSGSIPQLPLSLISLDVSYNHLSGSIPTELGEIFNSPVFSTYCKTGFASQTPCWCVLTFLR